MRLTNTEKILDSIKSGLAIAGAIVMSTGVWEAYYILAISNITAVLLSYKLGLRASLVQNIVFFLTAVFGIYNTCL